MLEQLVFELIHKHNKSFMTEADGSGDLSHSTSECFELKQTSVHCFLLVSSPTGQN